MKKLAIVLAIAALGTGCVRTGEFSKLFDQVAFCLMGATPLTNIEPLTMKEIHLDNGSLLGREVVVKGTVVGQSSYSTYLVLSDETARLLIVTTDLDSLMPKAGKDETNVVSILGTVESGKKGLPYLKASSIHIMGEPSQS